MIAKVLKQLTFYTVTDSDNAIALEVSTCQSGRRVKSSTILDEPGKMSLRGGAVSGLFGPSAGILLVLLCLTANFPHPASASPWDTTRFPNVLLTTQNGEQVRFFDDLVKGKVVVINFIFTSCVDTCPLETAHLVQVAKILGERVGQDVFFYSITIDPEVDTPAVLREYARRYGASWTFLTGDNADITLLRRRLGLYIEEIQDGSNNHNVSMIIGNEATGQWRKSSPFENAYIAAEKIGRWLTGWKQPTVGGDYDEAPALRRLSRGEQLFRNRCSSCHTIDGDAPGTTRLSQRVGPDLSGVTRLRERKWLIEWISAPDKMLARGDPIAMSLFREYGELPMPNLRLNQVDVMALIDFLDDRSSESEHSLTAPVDVRGIQGHADHRHADHNNQIDAGSDPGDNRLQISNARIRAPVNNEPATAGYVSISNVSMSATTILKLESPDFERIEMHETVSSEHGARMQRIDSLTMLPGKYIEFTPGGKHLMMIGPRGMLKEGQRVRVIATLSSGRQRVITFEVVMNTLPQHTSAH